MWAIFHDSLLMNESLYDRGLHLLDGGCGVCPNQIGNSEHVLIDCIQAREFGLSWWSLNMIDVSGGVMSIVMSRK